MLFAVICLAAAVIIFIYLRWEYSSYVKTIDLIPGPPKVAVFGNALLLPRDIHGNQNAKLVLIYFILAMRLNPALHLHNGYSRIPTGSPGKMAKNVRSHLSRVVWLPSFHRHIFASPYGGTLNIKISRILFKK